MKINKRSRLPDLPKRDKMSTAQTRAAISLHQGDQEEREGRTEKERERERKMQKEKNK